VPNIFDGILSTGAFISHGHDDLWQAQLHWLHLTADAVTGIADYAMPILSIYFVRKRPDFQFDKLIFLFSAFTISCGTSHLMEILTLWYPTYWLSGLLKVVMAIVSVCAVIELRSVLPKLLQLPSLKVTNENLEREIAERQRMEAALRNSEQLQRAIVESVNYSIISTTLEGKIRSFNTAAQRWLGYTESEVIGMTPAIIHDLQEITDRATALSQKLGVEIAPGFQRFVMLSLHGEFSEQEWTYIRKDGSRFPVLLSITSLRDDKDNVTGFVAIGSDITERKQAEAALLQSKDELEARVIERTLELSQSNQQLAVELRERQRTQAALEVSQSQLKDALRTLNFHFENSPLGVVEWNRDFQVIRWSGSAEKIFGWSAGEVLGKHLSEWQFVYLEDVERTRLEVAGLLDGTIQRSICHNRNYRKDGSIVNCEWYNSALLDKDGKMKSVLSMGLDVTDRDRVERMKNEFISVVSHELRTPLTSIYGALGMLASGSIDPQSDKAKRLVDIAVNSTERLIRMINDILDIERIESGKVRMQKECCAVTDLLTTAVNTVQPLAEQAKVSIVVSTISDSIYADADRIVRALTNLLSNSIKFSAPGQTIDCKVEREPGYLLFQVRDRGRGIPPEQLESIFERFQQVDSSDSRNHEGTGLGLAISRTIVQQHSGKIWAESVVGEGSAFFFRLPASDESPL
jgi:PAS domain S-box-containing protein